MPTIKDIADETGFSVATISRVLNQDQKFNVSDETRLKIMTAAEKMNYVPLNRRQKTDSSEPQKIDILSSSLSFCLVYWYDTQDELVDPYYLSIRLAIEQYCESRKISLQRFLFSQKNIELLAESQFDGIIALGKFSPEEVHQLENLTPHCVLVDTYAKNYNLDVVLPTLKEATEDILAYFEEKGLTDAGFIGGQEKTLDGIPIAEVRLKTYRKWKFCQEDAVYLGEFNAESGYQLMKNIIEGGNLKKAYLIASDAMAIGCLKALNEFHISVPDEVSLISFNNISLSLYTIPALTTLDLNTQLLGETAASLLEERATSNRKIGKKIFIPTQLTKRDSSK